MSYLGNYPNNPAIGPPSLLTVTATALQTTFSVTYTFGFLTVFRNGILLIPNDDYIANDGVSVILTSGAAAADKLAFIIGNAVANGNITNATTALNALNLGGVVATLAAVPNQSGAAPGSTLITNGTTASWTPAVPNTNIPSPGANIFLATYFGGF